MLSKLNNQLLNTMLIGNLYSLVNQSPGVEGYIGEISSHAAVSSLPDGIVTREIVGNVESFSIYCKDLHLFQCDFIREKDEIKKVIASYVFDDFSSKEMYSNNKKNLYRKELDCALNIAIVKEKRTFGFDLQNCSFWELQGITRFEGDVIRTSENYQMGWGSRYYHVDGKVAKEIFTIVDGSRYEPDMTYEEFEEGYKRALARTKEGEK